MITSTSYWKGQSLLWFDDDQLHCNGYVFADYRGLPEESDRDEIEKAVHQWFGKIEVHFDEQRELEALGGDAID